MAQPAASSSLSKHETSSHGDLSDHPGSTQQAHDPGGRCGSTEFPVSTSMPRHGASITYHSKSSSNDGHEKRTVQVSQKSTDTVPARDVTPQAAGPAEIADLAQTADPAETASPRETADLAQTADTAGERVWKSLADPAQQRVLAHHTWMSRPSRHQHRVPAQQGLLAHHGTTDEGSSKKVSSAHYELFRQAVMSSKGSFKIVPAKTKRAARASLLDLGEDEKTDGVSWMDQLSLLDTMASTARIAQGLKDEGPVKKTMLSEALNSDSSTFKHFIVKQVFPRKPYRLKMHKDAQYRVTPSRCVYSRGNTQRQLMVSLLPEAGFLARNQLPSQAPQWISLPGIAHPSTYMAMFGGKTL